MPASSAVSAAFETSEKRNAKDVYRWGNDNGNGAQQKTRHNAL
jgi:hypothetical protein